MGLYIPECRSMGEITGNDDVIPELDARSEAALQTLRDEEFGFFLNKNLRSGLLPYIALDHAETIGN